MSQTTEPVRVTSDQVTVERTVERKQSGVTVEYRVTSEASGSRGVRVVEGLDGGAEDVGFHPDHSPAHWNADDAGVTFEVVVEPGEETAAVLGLVASSDAPLLAGEPRLDAVAPVDPDALDPDAGTVFAAPDRGGFLSGVKRRILGSSDDDPSAGSLDTPEDGDVVIERAADGEAARGDAMADGASDAGPVVEEAEGDADATPEEPTDEAVTIETAGDEGTDGDEGAGGDDGANGDESDGDGVAGDAGADDGVDEAGYVEAVVDVNEGEVVDETDESDGTVGESDGTVGETDGTDEADGAVDEAESRGAVAELAAEIEAGEVDEADLDVLREALDVEDGEGEGGAESADATGAEAAESVSVRLRHVQGRMDEFAAYVDALEGVIDEHGSDFLAETESRLDDLDGGVTALRGRLDEAAAAREDLREEVAGLREDVEGVREETEALRESVGDLREAQNTRVRRLEDDVDALATDMQGMRSDLRGEIEDLRGDVEDLAEMRRALSTALGGDED